MTTIRIASDNLKPFLSDEEVENLQPEITRIHDQMERGEGAGSDFLGWRNLPSNTPEELIERIEDSAATIREDADCLIVIGIGGSYLGARAAIEFVNHTFQNQLDGEKRKGPEIYFAGQNISSDYLSDLIDITEKRRVCLNVISKSGTTTEPAIAFRVLKTILEKQCSGDELKRRIVVTTDRERGALKGLADREGYTTFVIPDDVGGRYSVLTPVGLLPIAAAGIDIRELLRGARAFVEIADNPDLGANPAYFYGAVRHLLYLKGKVIEILSSFHPSLYFIGEWWKQLTGESEGKNHRGIYPASVDLTTDLHSMGQWIQEGNRIIFETFLTVEQSKRAITIPSVTRDDDGLNYLAGKSLDFVNDKAYRGTASAHHEGGVPNMTIQLKDRSPYTLGQLFYFFERATAISCYLMHVNPFNQPGVEFYKRNMFSLLGKPGS
ncbi:MAG: glucose-6-phosphate isomerase [Thermodesulfobacteriota bacterium]